MGVEVALLPAEKQKSFPQGASIILGLCKQPCQSTQNNKFAISLQYLKESGKNKLVFGFEINIEDFFKLTLPFYVWLDMPKIPKITSLLFLCNILKKRE